MTYQTSKIRGLTLALVAVGSLVAATSADAKLYSGKWDPVYGSALPDLGWRGVAEFEIADECLSNLSSIDFNGWVDNSSGVCKDKLSIKSATVTLYDLDSISPDVILSYSSASLLDGGNIPFAKRMYVDATGDQEAQIKAVDGGFWFPENVTASFAKAAGYKGALYWLGFSGDQPNLENNTQAQARLASCSYKWTSLECSLNDNVGNKGGAPAFMAITPVPEPQAYALGLASLAVVGAWTRRRRRDIA